MGAVNPPSGFNNLEMNIQQYPSEIHSLACHSGHLNEGSKQGSFVCHQSQEMPDGDLNILFHKMNQLTALCQETE